MFIGWKIQVVAEGAKRTDKVLFCRTEDISDIVTRYRLEFLARTKSFGSRKALEFRNLFSSEIVRYPDDDFSSLFVEGYWEDQSGNSISEAEAMQRLFNVPKDSLRLESTKPHSIRFQVALANGDAPFGPTLPTFSSHEQFILRHFTEDSNLLALSRFRQSSSFSLKSAGGVRTLETAGVEHISHFLAVFRRVYAPGENANFRGVCDIVHQRLENTPFADWLAGERKALNRYLSSPASSFIVNNGRTLTFNAEQLVHTFLYEKYLHQPDAENEMERAKRAAEVGGPETLEALFYFVITDISTFFTNWGRWTRKLCALAAIDLSRDSTGAAVSIVKEPTKSPEEKLSPEHRTDFEEYVAKIAFALRSNEADSNLDASACFAKAKSILRVLI